MENENLYNGRCRHCKETFSECLCINIPKKKQKEIVIAPLPNQDLDFSPPVPFNPEPDFDKMWLNIQERMESPYFYCLEIENSAGTYLRKNSNSLTRNIFLAERFFGKDGKAMAELYLYLNQEQGSLKEFIVTEHEFV